MLPLLCFGQRADDEALRDARLAGQAALHSLAVQQQHAQGRITLQQFQRETAKDSATVEQLRRPYAGTKAEKVFDGELSRITSSAAPAVPAKTTAPQTTASAGWFTGDWAWNIWGIILLIALAVGLSLANKSKPELSKNFGSATYAPQQLTMPTPYYAMQGVFFGKSSHPDLPLCESPDNPGAPICSMPQNHSLIVARTRTGKLTRICVPTLLRYVGSVMVIDPKGENAAITARTRAGFTTVHIINPWRELEGTFKGLGITPATYNPLDVLDRNDDRTVATAQAMANAICPVTPGKETFWEGSAASVMTAVLLWLTDQPGETKTLARAREIVTLTRKKLKEEFLVKMAVSSAFDGAIRENAAPFVDMADDTYSGVMSNLAESTKFLSDPLVKKATAASTFSMGDLVREPTSLYLVIPPDKIDTQRTWLRLMIAAAMHTFKRVPVEDRPAHRCMFLIDEFPALGRLPDLPRDIATMSGYGVDFTLIIQGLDQLKDHYGDAQGTILSNCAYKWFCNVNDLDSARYLSETLGKATVQTIGHSTSESHKAGDQGGSAGESMQYGETGRALLMPDEVLNLGRETAILLNPEGPPHYLRPVDYWNLPSAFASLKSAYPHLYWDPPLSPDPNPYYKKR